MGLSGYRVLTSGNGENVTSESLLDKFLSNERRSRQPNLSLWEWSKICNCNKSNCCNSDHAPIFTGMPQYTNWPVSEDFAKGQLIIHSKMEWAKAEDFKGDHDSYASAFSEFLDSFSCPDALHKVVNEIRERSLQRNKRVLAPIDLENEEREDGYFQDCQDGRDNFDLGADMMKEMAGQNNLDLADAPDLPPLCDGGVGFNWNEYGLQSLGFPPSPDANEWISKTSEKVEKYKGRNFNLDSAISINLLLANPLQRVVIAINLIRLMQIKNGTLPRDSTPLRLLIQGTAGVGKTFVIKGITYITRRIFKHHGSVMNTPTCAASVLLPQDCTFNHAIPRKQKISKDAQLQDMPLSHTSLNKLRELLGSHK